MKKILILTIALLFVAGFAMAELKVTGEVMYFNAYYSGDAGNQFASGGYAKIMFAGGNDFASIAADIKGKYHGPSSVTFTDSGGDTVTITGDSTMQMDLVDNAYIKLDVLGALGVEGVPVKLTATFGYKEIKGTEVWKVTRTEIEATTVDAGGRAGQFAADIVIMDMVTITLAQMTTNGLAIDSSAYSVFTIAPTLISAKASIEFVNVSVNASIAQAYGSTDLQMIISGGAAADLAKILGVDMITSLKIGAGVSADNIDTAAEYDITYGAGVNFGLAPMDKVTLRLGVSTAAEIDGTAGVNSDPFQDIGLDIEVWYDFIGIGANTSLSFGNKLNSASVDMLGQTEVSLLAKLSGVDLKLGFIMNPAEVNAQGVNDDVKKYAEKAPSAGNMGLAFKASCKL
jgi:hypothetical protein